RALIWRSIPPTISFVSLRSSKASSAACATAPQPAPRRQPRPPWCGRSPPKPGNSPARRARIEARTPMKTFALALGGGGARGLAHIAVIEALDEMGLKPVAIAGTSIGALIGAAYAAGMNGKDIRHHVIRFAHDRREIMSRLVQARAGKLTDLFSGAFSQATQMDAEKFCAQFLPDAIPAEFSALAIPLIAMAT